VNEIKAKIYYFISTGEILTITPEGTLRETTKEQDMEIYEQLKDKNIDEIDYIELEYGTLASIFNNVKSYSVDVKTKTLKYEYYTQEELDTKKQKQKEQQIILDRKNTISTYVNLDTTSIEDLEKYFLLREKNKTIGGIR